MTITTDPTLAGNEDQQDAKDSIITSTNPADSASSKLLVALDVDGTLVDHTGKMSQAVRTAARDAAEAGHHLVISTGRSIGATLPIVRELGIESGYCVSSNGGVVVRLDPDLPEGYEVVERTTFDPGPALGALRVVLPQARFAIEDGNGEFLSHGNFQDASFGAAARDASFEEMQNSDAVRLVVFSPDNTTEEFGKAVAEIGLHGVTYSVGWTAWLDIAAKGTTKATALENVRARLGIDPANTLAIGDGRNDIEMLRWAGHGVAMGQAPAEVRMVADAVTDPVESDGAAKVLERIAA